MRIRYIVALFLAIPTASAQELYRMEKSSDAMGATFTVALYGTDRAAMEAAIDAALAEAQRLDALLSNYRPESEWSAVNRGAGSKPVKVSAELFRLLAACLDYSRESDGAFDITVGPLMKIWGFYKSSGHLAPKAEVEAALGKGAGIVTRSPHQKTALLADVRRCPQMSHKISISSLVANIRNGTKKF